MYNLTFHVPADAALKPTVQIRPADDKLLLYFARCFKEFSRTYSDEHCCAELTAQIPDMSYAEDIVKEVQVLGGAFSDEQVPNNDEGGA